MLAAREGKRAVDDLVERRRRPLITPDQLPWRTPKPTPVLMTTRAVAARLPVEGVDDLVGGDFERGAGIDGDRAAVAHRIVDRADESQRAGLHRE